MDNRDRLILGLTGVTVSFVVVLGALVTGVLDPADLRDEVWPQRQEAPACPPPAAPTGGHAYG